MVYKKVCSVILGGIYWRWLDKKYHSERYIFFPSENIEYNLWGILMLDSYVKRGKYKKITVITTNKRIISVVKKQRIGEISFKLVSGKRMEKYMCYYALRNMSYKWTVVSTQKPYDTGAERLLGKCGITYKDIVYYDIYGFSDEEIVYGDEKTIREELMAG